MTDSHQSLRILIVPDRIYSFCDRQRPPWLATNQKLTGRGQHALPLLFKLEEQSKIGPASPALRPLGHLSTTSRTTHHGNDEG